MMKKLTFIHYLPGVVCILCALAVFGLMAIPSSQYELLSLMAKLNEMTTDTQQLINLRVAVPGLMVIFNLLWLAALILLSVITLFASDIYTMKQFHNFIFPLPLLILVNSIIYFAVGYGVAIEKTMIVSSFNIIYLIAVLLFTTAYYSLWYRFIRTPFLELKKDVMEGRIVVPDEDENEE